METCNECPLLEKDKCGDDRRLGCQKDAEACWWAKNILIKKLAALGYVPAERWRKVAEELPEPFKKLLCWNVGMKEPIKVWMDSDGEFRLPKGTYGWRGDGSPVVSKDGDTCDFTHWLPFPDPPKEEAEWRKYVVEIEVPEPEKETGRCADSCKLRSCCDFMRVKAVRAAAIAVPGPGCPRYEGEK